jgi:hypothetical protein
MKAKVGLITGVNDTGDKNNVVNIFVKIRNGPKGIHRGPPGETDA